MRTFIDPRDDSVVTATRATSRITRDLNQLSELHALCRDGRLYDVERWIASGRPLQAAQEVVSGRATSALAIALEAGNHSLVLLLLANGYDVTLGAQCPLDHPLRSRRSDLVTLLLDWGADPHRVDLDDLFATYNSELFERFYALGVDFAANHALADVLAHHTSNKPLLGFAKRHRLTDPTFQTELDIALAHHASGGNEKGVQLCLWAGADPHTPVPILRFGLPKSPPDDDVDNDDQLLVSSAIYEACQAGRDDLLKRLGPDPSRDDFEELWRAAGSAAAIGILAKHQLPHDGGSVVQHHLWWATFSTSCQRLDNLKRLFDVGVRWDHGTPDAIGHVRRLLLKASDNRFVELIKVLALADHCSPNVLRELARTPSMLARMKKVGFIQSRDKRGQASHPRPTHSGEVLKKFSIQPPVPRRSKRSSPPAPRSVVVGRQSGKPIELDREELFNRVWSKPVATVARDFGLSGPGLKKICVRLAIPVPPRGYWAKLSAGQSVKRPRLPNLS